MARSTFRAPVNTYTFSATGTVFGSLPPIQFHVENHPFELREYFELDEAKALRDELAAAIEEVESARATEIQGRELHALDGGAK